MKGQCCARRKRQRVGVGTHGGSSDRSGIGLHSTTGKRALLIYLCAWEDGRGGMVGHGMAERRWNKRRNNQRARDLFVQGDLQMCL